MNFCGFLNEFTDKNEKEVIIKGTVSAEIISCSSNSITINVPQQDSNLDSIIGFAALDYDNKFLWYNETEVTEGENTVVFDGFDYFVADRAPIRYKLYAVFEEDGVLHFCRFYSQEIKEKYKATYDRNLLYYDVIAEGRFEDEDYCTCLSVTRGGYFALLVFNKKDIYNFRFTNTVDDVEVVDGKLTFDVKVNKVKEASEWALVGMDKSGEEPVYYDLPPQPFDDDGDCFISHCSLTRDFIKLPKPTTLSLYTKYVVDGKPYYTRVSVSSPKVSKKIRKISYEEFLQLNDDLKAFTIRSLDNDIQFVSVAPSTGYELVNNSVKDTILSEDFNVSRVLFCTQSVSEKGEYNLHLNPDMSEVEEMWAYCYFPKTKEKVIVDVVSWDKDTGDLSLNLSNLKKSCKDFTARSYMLCIAFLYEGLVYPAKLKNPNYHGKLTAPELLPLEKRLFPVVERFDINGVEVSLAPIYFVSGNIYIAFSEGSCIC